jgi:hypothetical protein
VDGRERTRRSGLASPHGGQQLGGLARRLAGLRHLDRRQRHLAAFRPVPQIGNTRLGRRPLRLAAGALDHQQARPAHARGHAQVHVDVRRMEHPIDPGGGVARVEQP